MIAIVSPHPRERNALAALCDSRNWPSVACDSWQALQKITQQRPPKIVVTRLKVADGYSDDILAGLSDSGAKFIVMVGAATSAALQARQIALGADCVLRDPVRTDVLSEYLARFLSTAARVSASASTPARARSFRFAGATVHPLERTLRHAERTAELTPREVELIGHLHASPDEVVTYQKLYAEMLGRSFTGDTSNMRVLLRKLDASFRLVGLHLRDHLEVIPKTGYRYLRPRSRALRVAVTTAARESDAA